MMDKIDIKAIKDAVKIGVQHGDIRFAVPLGVIFDERVNPAWEMDNIVELPPPSVGGPELDERWDPEEPLDSNEEPESNKEIDFHEDQGFGRINQEEFDDGYSEGC